MQSSKGIFNEDSDVFLGIFGYSGHKRAHEVILSQKADLSLLIGFDVTSFEWADATLAVNSRSAEAVSRIFFFIYIFFPTRSESAEVTAVTDQDGSSGLAKLLIP